MDQTARNHVLRTRVAALFSAQVAAMVEATDFLEGPDDLPTVDALIPDVAVPGIAVAANASRAALELAIVDCALRRANRALAALLPPRRRALRYSGVITAGSLDTVVQHARQVRTVGLRDVKVKVGFDDDVARVAAVRKVLGGDVTVRLDANGAWMRLWALRAMWDHPGLLARKLLTIVSPAVEGRTPSGLPFGSMSGLTYRHLPWLVRRRHVLPYEATLIRDYDTRYFVAARLALADRVSSIGTPNPTTLLRLAETAEEHGEAIIRAIHDGTLGAGALEPVEHAGCSDRDLREALQRAAHPARARAAFLAHVMERRGRLVLGDCWPDLALVACWLGGNAGVHARRLGEHFGAVPLRDLGLVASEGRLTVPIEDGSSAGVLAVHAGFFEFVPEERIDDAAAETLLAHQLEDGHRYYIVITEANGLYRYDLNDVVEVRGFHHSTPKVAFVRKGRDMLSITGEKLHLNHVLAAVREAERRSGLDVWQFRVIPDVEEIRYDVLIEPARTVVGSAQEFLASFDATLAAGNVEYASKRASRRLGAPRLHLMARGWSERLCRGEFAHGRREHQHKWRAVAEEWDPVSRGEVERTEELVVGERCQA